MILGLKTEEFSNLADSCCGQVINLLTCLHLLSEIMRPNRVIVRMKTIHTNCLVPSTWHLAGPHNKVNILLFL